ncbi:MAG: hypothetical protein HQK55_15470 [Deltaproteobacteria bacterium]|nr:hypothetical protein [Deltaproteobacteria bacterium]
MASDYFLDGFLNEQKFRDELRRVFNVKEVKKDKTYYFSPEDWWMIYGGIFKYDPNSLVHGLMFAKEQIKIPRFLTAHLEAFGAARVGRSGVKFDRLGKTTSGQPIFAVDEEIAREIKATFILDLALLRSMGWSDNDQEKGLTLLQKKLIFNLALWKINRLLCQPFRFRSGCYLECIAVTSNPEIQDVNLMDKNFGINIKNSIKECQFGPKQVTTVYYPAAKLFKVGTDEPKSDDESEANSDDETDRNE